MTVFSELDDFIRRHRACVTLPGDADLPTTGGYHLWLMCSCGVTIERWVNPQDAEEDLLPEN
jgi:hypothetical protein